MVSGLEVRHSAAVGALETIRYRHDGFDAWVSSLHGALRAVCPSLVPSMIMLMRREPTRLAVDQVNDGGFGAIAQIAHQFFPLIDAEVADQVFREADIVSLGTVYVRKFPRWGERCFELFLRPLGLRDTFGLLAQAGHYTLCIAGAAEHELVLGARQRATLTRLALHIEAALRLHLDPGCVAAVVRPDGRVVHAEGRARDERGPLSAHIGTVERLRLRGERRRDDAIESWTALISGRYTMVERFDARRREYLVLENPPHALGRRALGEREARALELSARGEPNKMVAYSLGLSEPTISKLLASAAGKLGLPDGASLVRLAAGVLRPHAAPLIALTPSERDIVDMLEQGWSNATIAQARGTSPRTVANQIAALLRKTGAASRRALSGL